MLGFAMRAGRLIIGCEQVFTAMQKRGYVKLVGFCPQASEPTRKKIHTKCEFYGTPKVSLSITPEELGSLLGKVTAPVCIGVTDEGFAKEIAKAASEENNPD